MWGVNSRSFEVRTQLEKSDSTAKKKSSQQGKKEENEGGGK